MSSLPQCPECGSEFTYKDGSMFICPECAYEWPKAKEVTENANDQRFVHDAHGNVLQDGDTVSVIKDLKIKGSSSVVKVGTKVKNISLVDDSHFDGNHDIDCKIDGIGVMQLKSEFVRKV